MDKLKIIVKSILISLIFSNGLFVNKAVQACQVNETSDYFKHTTRKPRELMERFPFLNEEELIINEEENQHYWYSKINRPVYVEQDKYGKRYLSWTFRNLLFEQYENSDDIRKTLKITSPNKPDVSYFKQQRFESGEEDSLVQVYFDSKYQVEYWKDGSTWVVEDPFNFEWKFFPSRKKAILYVKSYGYASLSADAAPHAFEKPDVIKVYGDKEEFKNCISSDLIRHRT